MTFPFFRKKKAVTKNISMEEILSILRLQIKYFERHSKAQSSFLPELEISMDILRIIETTNTVTEDSLLSIAKTYNKIIGVDHYDGTGWFGFKIRLSSYFYYYGYYLDWDKETDELRFRKMTE
jgi:hypothetical protein